MVKRALAPAYRLLELPLGYVFIQWVNRPTVLVVRQILRDKIMSFRGGKVLDLGCGTGNYRPYFGGDYYGIDINDDYIVRCRAVHPGRFAAMDATRLGFGEQAFDSVVTVATTHHLDDRQVRDMIDEAMRVLRPGGDLHVVDAVLPDSRRSLLKTTWFRLDRGNHPRKRGHLMPLLEQAGAVRETEVRSGPLHDVLYARIAKPAA